MKTSNVDKIIIFHIDHKDREKGINIVKDLWKYTIVWTQHHIHGLIISRKEHESIRIANPSHVLHWDGF